MLRIVGYVIARNPDVNEIVMLAAVKHAQKPSVRNT